MHLLLFGILLGWGAAVPIGPVNIEITRRNLSHGSRFGIATGVGANGADLAYLILLTSGAMVLLQHPTVLKIVGVIGSLILGWFAYQALTTKTPDFTLSQTSNKSISRNAVEGFLMTFFNPYTILFWASVSSQLSLAARHQEHAVIFAGIGVILGAFSWVLVLNFILHKTRHKLPTRFAWWLNIIGGVILLLFAVIGILHAFY